MKKIIVKGLPEIVGVIQCFSCDDCGTIWNADELGYTTHSSQINGTYYKSTCPICSKTKILEKQMSIYPYV